MAEGFKHVLQCTETHRVRTATLQLHVQFMFSSWCFSMFHALSMVWPWLFEDRSAKRTSAAYYASCYASYAVYQAVSSRFKPCSSKFFEAKWGAGSLGWKVPRSESSPDTAQLRASQSISVPFFWFPKGRAWQSASWAMDKAVTRRLRPQLSSFAFESFAFGAFGAIGAVFVSTTISPLAPLLSPIRQRM